MLRIIFIFVCLLSFAYGQQSEKKERERVLEYVISKTWKGEILPVEDRINVTLKSSPRGIRLLFTAPFYNDTEPNCRPGENRTELWRCEALEFYFANDKNEYILAQYSPYAEKITYFFDGERNYIRERIVSKYEVRMEGSLWKGFCFIYFQHLPYNVTKFQLGSYHGVGENRKFNLLYPSDGGTLSQPDFHKLEFFEAIDLTQIFGENYVIQNSEWDRLRRGSLNYTIETTWNGVSLPVEDRINITLDGIRNPEGLCVKIDAPFFDDNDPKCKPGPEQIGLWKCEAVILYFLNDNEEYLQVMFSPYGMSVVKLLSGEKNFISKLLTLKFDSEIKGTKWNGTAVIPRGYFPQKVKRFNTASTHGSGENRKYNALYSAHESATEPDFHKLQYFQPIDMFLLRSYTRNQSLVWHNALMGMLNFTIETTWNGSSISPEEMVNITLNGVEVPEGLCVRIRAPLHNRNNSICPLDRPDLLDCEGIELYFLNGTNQYLKLRLGPFGDYEAQLYMGRQNLFKGNLTLEFKANVTQGSWNGRVLIPRDYLPYKPSKFNAASYYGFGDAKQCNVLYPSDGTLPKSDFPILSLFKETDFAVVRSYKRSPSKFWQEI